MSVQSKEGIVDNPKPQNANCGIQRSERRSSSKMSRSEQGIVNNPQPQNANCNIQRSERRSSSKMSRSEHGIVDNPQPQNANCSIQRSERFDEAAAGTSGLSIDIPNEEKEERHERKGREDGGGDAERSQRENLKAWISSRGERIIVFTGYLNPMLLGVLGVQFPDKSAFTTQRVDMAGFVVAIIMYAAALAARNTFSGTICNPCIDLILICTGSFMSASLMAVLLPPLAAPIIFVIWGIFFIYILTVARHLIKSLCSSIYNRIKEICH